MADPSFAILKEVLDELYRKNEGRAPTAKQMAAATLLTVKEAQMILDELQGESTCPEPEPKKAKKENPEKPSKPSGKTAASAKDLPPSQPVDQEAALSSVPPGAFEEANSGEEAVYAVKKTTPEDEVEDTQLDVSGGAGTPPYSPSVTTGAPLRRAKCHSQFYLLDLWCFVCDVWPINLNCFLKVHHDFAAWTGDASWRLWWLRHGQ